MARSVYYHTGQFKVPVTDPYADAEFYYDASLYIDITTYTGPEKDLTGCYFRIFPDSANSIRWLREHGLLTYEIVEGSFLG